MNNCGKCDHSCNHKNHDSVKDVDYLVKIYIEIEVDKDDREYSKVLKSKLMSFPGVKEVSLGGDCLEIIFDEMITSPEEIKGVLK